MSNGLLEKWYCKPKITAFFDKLKEDYKSSGFPARTIQIYDYYMIDAASPDSNRARKNLNSNIKKATAMAALIVYYYARRISLFVATKAY